MARTRRFNLKTKAMKRIKEIIDSTTDYSEVKVSKALLKHIDYIVTRIDDSDEVEYQINKTLMLQGYWYDHKANKWTKRLRPQEISILERVRDGFINEVGINGTKRHPGFCSVINISCDPNYSDKDLALTIKERDWAFKFMEETIPKRGWLLHHKDMRYEVSKVPYTEELKGQVYGWKPFNQQPRMNWINKIINTNK